jgi:hypothetical protein
VTPIARAYFVAIISGLASVTAASADLFVPALGMCAVCVVSGVWAERAGA